MRCDPLGYDRATGFLAFMNGYTVFLGPFAGIMVTDVRIIVHVGLVLTHALQYWLVHHGLVDVPSMYRPHGRYRYYGGFVSHKLNDAKVLEISRHIQNWRAALAILISVPPNLPGLINSITPTIKVGGAVHLFDLAWLFGVSLLFTIF
jgi:NCS1 family nucleobase:cation symporter-1